MTKIISLTPLTDSRLVVTQYDSGTVHRTVVALAVVEDKDGNQYPEMVVAVDGGLCLASESHRQPPGEVRVPTVSIDGSPANNWGDPSD
ncbi:hypothetical protein A5664_01705 [Mycolicibacterium fortuitum]|uniref:hypothetical protein n=1 Tax=Mycolicibacterium fortuitum TaxID=1766 RepID=UPI0007ECC4EE|nr:hypothetical protein [Mycolicibacterium fortuitum]OBI79709.1 hypothetical protein A5664_01705 [Mycolicibacterium fortuitum]